MCWDDGQLCRKRGSSPFVILNKGENITNMDGTSDRLIAQRKVHTSKIENLLGVKVHFMDFPGSRIDITIEGAHKVAAVIRELKPDIIITWQDEGARGYPDHNNTDKLVTDAIFYCRVRDPGTDLPPSSKTYEHICRRTS